LTKGKRHFSEKTNQRKIGLLKTRESPNIGKSKSRQRHKDRTEAYEITRRNEGKRERSLRKKEPKKKPQERLAGSASLRTGGKGMINQTFANRGSECRRFSKLEKPSLKPPEHGKSDEDGLVTETPDGKEGPTEEQRGCFALTS